MGSPGLKILVLTFYYPPDLSAGSFRAAALVAALSRRAPAGSTIEVITTVPNRYQSFIADAPQREERAGVSIHRIDLSSHRSGMLDQSIAFIGFARGASAQAAKQRYDIVFATSSRLMTAVLGARIARRARSRLYLDFRDIFADTMPHVVPRAVSPIVRKVFATAERFAVNRARKVSVVSPGFLDYFHARYPNLDLACFTNGIDSEFGAAAPVRQSPSPRLAGPETLTALYAGNIGEGQGLHLVVPELARALGRRICFIIIGDGGRRRQLATAIAAAGLRNIKLVDPIGRDSLIAAYRGADVLFLHLNDYAAFDRVLPSKLFEYAAMGKPVWAGVSGFAADFVRSEIANSAVFKPCDVPGAVRSLEQLVLEDAPRIEFMSKYGRTAISERLADDVIAVAASASTDTHHD